MQVLSDMLWRLLIVQTCSDGRLPDQDLPWHLPNVLSKSAFLCWILRFLSGVWSSLTSSMTRLLAAAIELETAPHGVTSKLREQLQGKQSWQSDIEG